MKVSAEIWHVASEHGDALFNICELSPGGIGVSVHAWSKPTYLLRWAGIAGEFRLVQFDSEEWAAEWFEHNNANWEIVQRLDQGVNP